MYWIPEMVSSVFKVALLCVCVCVCLCPGYMVILIYYLVVITISMDIIKNQTPMVHIRGMGDVQGFYEKRLVDIDIA